MKTSLNKMCAAIAAVLLPGMATAAPVKYDGPAYPGWLTTKETVIWQNRTLADLEFLSGTINGSHLGKNLAATGVVVERGADKTTVQFQANDGGKTIRAVRAYFKQSGNDIVGWGDNSAYITDISLYGTVLSPSHFTRPLATGLDTESYGVYGLEALGDDTWTENGMPDAPDGLVVNAGILRVNLSGDAEAAMPISGTGGLRFAGEGALTREVTFDRYMTTSDQVVLSDTDLFDVEVVSGVINGGSCGRKPGACPFNVSTNLAARTITVQMQVESGPHGVIVVLSQSDTNVVAKATRAAKPDGTGLKYGSDMELWTETIRSVATSATASGYGLESLSFKIRSAPVVRLSGEKSWTGGIVADGAIVKVRSSDLPSAGVMKAANGGTIDLGFQLSDWSSRASVRYEIGPGSRLLLNAPFPLALRDSVVVKGGTVSALFDNEYRYLNHLTLEDGAVADVEVRIGNDNVLDSVWKSSGEMDVSVEKPVTLVRSSYSETSEKLILDLSADMVFNGAINDLSNRAGLPVVKRGSADAVFAGGCAVAGKMTLEAGGIVADSSVSFGALALSGNAAIELTEAGTLSFADSSAETWAQDAVLDITGGFSSSAKILRFGTSSSGLTAWQLRALRINGLRCSMDADGWIHPTGGFTVICR